MGFEIYDFGMFGGRKILAGIFQFGQLGLSRDFFVIQNNLKIRDICIISDAFWKFLWLGSSALDFLGVIFWSKDSYGFV